MESKSKQASLFDPTWLAGELHDGMLQWIYAAKLKLEAELKKTPSNQTELLEIKELLSQAQSEGRGLLQLLDQDSAYSGEQQNPFTLLASFVEQAQAMCSPSQSLRLDTSWYLEASRFEGKTLPASHTWNLVRIGQQAAVNAIQHVPQAAVVLRLSVEPNRLILEVTNTLKDHDENGSSTSLAKSELARLEKAKDRFGLANMKNRAQLIGAEIDWEFLENSGRVTVGLDMRSNRDE